jgi:hypothetical protein
LSLHLRENKCESRFGAAEWDCVPLIAPKHRVSLSIVPKMVG